MKESNKNLEDKVKELEEQLSKNKSKVKSQKVQLEQLRKSHKAKDMEEESAKSKTEVKNIKLFKFKLNSCWFSFASDWSNGGESFNDQLQSEVRKTILMLLFVHLFVTCLETITCLQCLYLGPEKNTKKGADKLGRNK